MHYASKIILGGLLVALSLGDADARPLRRAGVGAPGAGATIRGPAGVGGVGVGAGVGAPGAGATVHGPAGVGGAGVGAPGAGATVRGPAGIGR